MCVSMHTFVNACESVPVHVYMCECAREPCVSVCTHVFVTVSVLMCVCSCEREHRLLSIFLFLSENVQTPAWLLISLSAKLMDRNSRSHSLQKARDPNCLPM